MSTNRPITRSERRREAKLGVLSRKTRLGWMIGIAVAILAVTVTIFTFRPRRQQEGFMVSGNVQELKELADSMLAAINPVRPENQYMPPFMREKILWYYNEGATGRAVIHFYTDPDTGFKKFPLMRAMYIADSAVIEMGLDNFMKMLVMSGSRSFKSFSQLQKNNFAVVFVHEIVHLENPKVGGPLTPEEVYNEELRTWYRTNMNTVRPLVLAGQPLGPQLTEVDSVLRKCRDDINCPDFRKMIRTKLF